MVDYVIIDLTADGIQSSGMQQYYHTSHALEKLIKSCTAARLDELGKIAAAEYEKVTNDNTDYLTSV